MVLSNTIIYTTLRTRSLCPIILDISCIFDQEVDTGNTVRWIRGGVYGEVYTGIRRGGYGNTARCIRNSSLGQNTVAACSGHFRHKTSGLPPAVSPFGALPCAAVPPPRPQPGPMCGRLPSLPAKFLPGAQSDFFQKGVVYLSARHRSICQVLRLSGVAGLCWNIVLPSSLALDFLRRKTIRL